MISDLLQLCEQSSLITRTLSPSFHSLVVLPKVEPSTDFPPIHPSTNAPVASPPVVSPLHHTNPFTHSLSTPPPISPCNPFFSLLQQNPFYDHMLTARPLKPSPPPLPYLSTSRPPISHLFPNETSKDSSIVCGSVYSHATRGRTDRAGKRPLPPTPTEMFDSRPSKPAPPAGGLEPESQWDDSFEAFAAGRLQPPGDLTEARRDTSASLLLPSWCDAPGEVGWEPSVSTGSLTNANTTHFDGFAQFLETIPEHNDSVALVDAAHTESNQANSRTNVHFLSSANTDPSSRLPKLSSSSPDPASSGMGSSVEDDFLSCLSSYSDKFSASSAEESEALNLDADVISFEKSCESIRKSRPSESDDHRSQEPHLFRVVQDAVIQHKNGDVLEASPVGTQPQAVVAPLDSPGAERSRLVPAGDLPPTHVMSSSPPDVSFHIITSSPAVKQNSSGLLVEEVTWAGQGAGRHSPIPFGDFPTSPGGGFSELLLPPRSDRSSSSSFLHSLYLSSDSQNYQTCESSSKCSSQPNQTLHLADSTLRGELSGVLMSADAAQEVFPVTSEPSHEETHQRNSLECSSDILQPGFRDERRESRRRRFPGKAPTLQRSHSDGSLTSDEHPCGASSAAFPALTSSAPLTPELTSSPVALSSLPPFANATARSPPSMPQAAAPNPMSLKSQQQQAANQQNR